MGPVAMALGVDALARWVIRFLISFMIIGFVVTVIVIQTVAGVLVGGQPSQGTAASGTPVPETGVVAPAPTAGPPLATDLGGRIVEVARTWLDVPYLFGGCSRTGVDCSCLVQNVFAAVGIRLPRVAVDQFNATMPTGDPQAGDLVFFANTYQPGISHVGIYLGNGLQINAPTDRVPVSIEPVFTGYWGAHYAGAHRVRS